MGPRMKYQHGGPCGATTSEQEDLGEPCTVGMVMASERRKHVVTNDYSCTSATHTTFPSTSLDVTIAPSLLSAVNEDNCTRTIAREETDVSSAPATPTATLLPATPTETPATLTETGTTDLEHTMEEPATPATTATLLPATLTATPVADDVTMQWEQSIAEVATPAMTATLLPATQTAMPSAEHVPMTLERYQAESATPATPAMFHPTTTPETWENTIAHLKITGNKEVNQPNTDETPENDCFKERREFEEWEQLQPRTENLIPTDRWTEPGPEFDEVVAEKLNHLKEKDLVPTWEMLQQFRELSRPPSEEGCRLGVTHWLEPTQATVGPFDPGPWNKRTEAAPHTPYKLWQREPVDYRKTTHGNGHTDYD
ncbi:hypothetical protein GE061_007273 [Apolygus lucorum]|uniref:Uncharacterized protein n=1 Tax=Apolygus lucorum TaxID=248454 RepID=A0A8S9WT37_APOLU|nr:hypothetical protein GE061_007273 [Apolygus lucorum]